MRHAAAGVKLDERVACKVRALARLGQHAVPTQRAFFSKEGHSEPFFEFCRCAVLALPQECKTTT
jgi:hypothetical protein